MQDQQIKQLILEARWITLQGGRRLAAMAAIVLLVVGSAALVYFTGGIKFVYSHSMYLAILLAALLFQLPGGIATGLIGGLILGPWMPIDTLTGELQPTLNWIYRTGIFTLVGGSAGLMVSRLSRQVRRFQWIACHHLDSGLPNRAQLVISLEEWITNRGPGLKFGVFVLHLNNFIEITETLGIAATDSVAGQLAERLQPLLGDAPFCQLLPHLFGCGFQEAEGGPQPAALAERMLKATHAAFEIEELQVYVDVSIGIAAYPEHSREPSKLIQKAVIAAHRAASKLLPHLTYDGGVERTSRENITLLGMVSAALANDQFELHYQPIYDLQQETLAGLEALIRWRHPERGLISPAEFIPQLENTSLIYEVQEWVIKTVLHQHRAWKQVAEAGYGSINLSVRGLNHPRLVSSLEDFLAECQIEPGRLMFEITETSLMADPEETSAILGRLRELGVRIAVDDFGLGYSSLFYLKSLPVDCLKIDRDFIKDLPGPEKDQDIVRAALSVARALRIKVIAEGVETEGAYQWLKSEGCDHAQGFHIARPMPADEVLTWLAAPPAFRPDHS